MVTTGLLVVSNIKQFSKSLIAVQKYVNSLYVHLNIPPLVKRQPIPIWSRLISQLYIDSSIYSQNINLRILIAPLRAGCSIIMPNVQLKPIDMIFSDSHLPEICDMYRKQFNIPNPIIYLNDDNKIKNDLLDFQNSEGDQEIYNNVVLGGTFDRIHTGHKIFLTQAVLRTYQRLVIGVTTSKLTKSKVLPELILPVEERIAEIKEFLNEIDANINYEVVPIDDPFGPTKSDPNMDMIVVSAETLRGGEKVNELRIQNNLRSLKIFCIDVVESKNVDGPKESKISSSNTRIDLLGTRLRKPEPRPNLPKTPYIIGLTGGIASGKSKQTERLQNMGAVTIDCDKLAHAIYEPGQVCYDKIIQQFGKDIIADDGRINRQKLGAIVFADVNQLDTLNGIVWPQLMLEIKRRIAAVTAELKPKIIVLEAAILLRAGWETECHEIWSMIVPPEEAIRRVIARNNLNEEDAKKRLASQMSNDEIVQRSHIVFSSLWHSDYTEKQAKRAWKILMNELRESNRSSL